MKATFTINEETQVPAIKHLEFSDSDVADLDLPAGSYGIPMSTHFLLIPDKEYDFLEIVEESPGIVTIWLNDTFCLPNFPKEKIRIANE